MKKINNNENRKPIQSKPKKIGLDWIWFDFKTKPIGWTNNKTEDIGSDGFSFQNGTNPICEHPYNEITWAWICLPCDKDLRFVQPNRRCLMGWKIISKDEAWWCCMRMKVLNAFDKWLWVMKSLRDAIRTPTMENDDDGELFEEMSGLWKGFVGFCFHEFGIQFWSCLDKERFLGRKEVRISETPVSHYWRSTGVWKLYDGCRRWVSMTVARGGGGSGGRCVVLRKTTGYVLLDFEWNDFVLD